jgi:hypothetical protein
MLRMEAGRLAGVRVGWRKQKRERGRQTTAILITSPATFRRPRRCAAVPRVQAHRQRPSDPTLWRSTPGCGVRDRKATALVTRERRCRRASVRAVASVAQPRSATPDLKRTSWSSRHACERKHSRGLVRVTGLAPRKTLKLDASLYRARRGQYAGGFEGGD